MIACRTCCPRQSSVCRGFRPSVGGTVAFSRPNHAKCTQDAFCRSAIGTRNRVLWQFLHEPGTALYACAILSTGGRSHFSLYRPTAPQPSLPHSGNGNGSWSSRWSSRCCRPPARLVLQHYSVRAVQCPARCLLSHPALQASVCGTGALACAFLSRGRLSHTVNRAARHAVSGPAACPERLVLRSQARFAEQHLSGPGRPVTANGQTEGVPRPTPAV